ncbi:MAG: TIGR01777 family oxidoreductase [Kofleriaceae bacterium]|nr:TIGR01777 family oxidoreductase [Kofleriaceae bacterium]
MKTIVTGATGFIGSALVPALLARGDEVTVLARHPDKARTKLGNVTAIAADLETPGGWGDALAGQHAIVHLAGEPIAGKRWDARQKQVIRDSRVEATRTLVEAIAKLPAERRPRVLVSASGADYYPFASDKHDFDDDAVTEQDKPSDSYLGRLCRDWEKEAHAAEALGLRVVYMRTGIVLGPGGALGKMTTPFKLFVGGRIGSGHQFFSWIHLRDAVAAYAAATIDERYRGPINLVAGSVRNREFSKALGAAMHRPSWMPVPKLALKLAAGELAEYMLHGRNVVPAKLRELGFRWEFPDIDRALVDAVRAADS